MAQAKKRSKTTTKKNNRKDNTKIAIVIAIILVALVALVSTSYAFFTLQLNGTKDNEIEVGTFVLSLDDATANGISLQDAVPVTEKYATENYKAYKFTLENTGSVEASYDLSLESQSIGEGTQLETSYIHYQLKYGESEDLSESTTASGTLSADGEILTAQKIAGNGKKVYFELLLWVDKDATIEQVAGKKYVGKVKVDAIQSYGTDE